MTIHPWLVDRSRYVDDIQWCPRGRYLKYEYAGHGIEGVRMPLEAWLGITVDSALDGVFTDLQSRGATEPNLAQVRYSIAEAVKAYRAETTARGYTEEGSSSYTCDEQCALIEAMTWGYIRAVLPIVMEEYEIVSVQEELDFDLDWVEPIQFMSRPDLLLRHRVRRSLSLHDFKCKFRSTLDDGMVAQFNSSIQFAGMVEAVERKYKEPVESFYIHLMLVGSRGRPKKGGQQIDHTLQYNDLIYGEVIPAAPPATRESSVVQPRFWADRQPLWKARIPEATGLVSPIEWWVKQAPAEMVNSMFALLGPYERPTYLIGEVMEEIGLHEQRRAVSGKRLAELGKTVAWNLSDRPLGFELNAQRPRSWDCWRFNRRCEFFDICHKTVGVWPKPLESNQFKVRRPNHLLERVALGWKDPEPKQVTEAEAFKGFGGEK